ncbi:13711_t:CDS:2 [Entrophospora sp. SA101]|nr:13711_t:CDS:2 [Entrophospora sp. SA101]
MTFATETTISKVTNPISFEHSNYIQNQNYYHHNNGSGINRALSVQELCDNDNNNLPLNISNNNKQQHYHEQQYQFHRHSDPINLPTPLSSPNPALLLSALQTPNNINDLMMMPLSLQERRERNKVASAKYRAKKHKQNVEMNFAINELKQENNTLKRQVDELKLENHDLKDLIDKLKSKLVEGKILKLIRKVLIRQRKTNRSQYR